MKHLSAAWLCLCLAACGGDAGPSGGVSAATPIVVAPPLSSSAPNFLGNGTSVRSDDTAFIATFRDDDGTTYDARQLKGTAGWLVESSAALDGLLVYGQSNAGLSVATDTNKALHVALFPHTVVGSSLGFYGEGPATLSDAPAAFADLYDEPGLIGHFPATLDGYAAERVARDAGRAPTGLYVHTQFQGAQPIDSFVKGTANYQSLLADVRRTTATAKLYKRDFIVRGVVWIQGESRTGDYAATLERLADDLAADIMAITGQAVRPELMIQQINTTDAEPGITGVELDQLALARRRFGRGITLIGPMYQARFGAGDIIHVADIGKMALADVAGLVFDRVRRGSAFTPLWPLSAIRSGVTIDVRFAVPGNGLAFDTDFMPPTPNQGFNYWDDSRSARVVSVAIIGADTVRLTLDQVPTGANPRVQYALGNDAVIDGYASGRGNLYSEDPARSVYQRLGYPVPAKVRHYAIRFEQPLN
ncbi:MAG: hypothetical protein JO013_03190 [Alphaproteobacteria bacterium]|nr:hypothetical protein [Alphaproteobacteria bacterium]